MVATVRSGAFAAQLKYARSTVGTDRAASRRVLTDARPAWHAPAMLAGTVGGTVTGRCTSSVDHVERNLAVMDGRFGESRRGLEEV